MLNPQLREATRKPHPLSVHLLQQSSSHFRARSVLVALLRTGRRTGMSSSPTTPKAAHPSSASGDGRLVEVEEGHQREGRRIPRAFL